MCSWPNCQHPGIYYQRKYFARNNSYFWLLESIQLLNSEGFSHLTVNHSVNFVDPETGAHTNTIESTWRALKKSLPKHGTTKSLYDTYFAQYCVRKQFLIDKEDPFFEFLQLIKKVYQPSFEPTYEEIQAYRKRKAEKTPQIQPAKVVRIPLSSMQINTSTSSADDFDI